VGFVKRTCVFSGIQFTKHFIEFVFVKTNQLFGSNPNVILTLQTCGQRSGMAAGIKCRSLAFWFSVLICYVFPLSKCRGQWDLGLCTTYVSSYGPHPNRSLRSYFSILLFSWNWPGNMWTYFPPNYHIATASQLPVIRNMLPSSSSTWANRQPEERCSKIPRIWKENPLKCLTRLLGYLDITWTRSKILRIQRKSSKNRDFIGVNSVLRLA